MKLPILLVTLCCSLPCYAVQEKIIKDSQGMKCHIYTPDKIEKNKTYHLVVGVHGAGGNGSGAGGYKFWADRGDVIVIGPSFNSHFKNNKPPYQNGSGIHARKLITLFKQLQKDYKLHNKMFLTGFSGGSQFVHRFTMNHPKLVSGVAAHSGGSWATRGFGKYSKRAKKIPFAISCGEKDTGRSFAKAPLGRLDWFKEFRDQLNKDRFTHIAEVIPNTGHTESARAKNLTAQCFQIATGLGGGSKGEMIQISKQWKNAKAIIKKNKKAKKIQY